MDPYDDFSAEGYIKKKQDADARLLNVVEKEKKTINAIQDEEKELKTKAVKSTRNALKTARETETVGKSALARLHVQGEHLEKTDEKMRVVDAHALRNYKKAKEVKQYDKFLGIPYGRLFTRKKQAVDHEYDVAKHQIELERQAVAERYAPPAESPPPNNDPAESLPAGVEAGPQTRYADAEDQEMDRNLDEINDAVDNLRAIGLNMNEEMDRQKTLVSSIEATRKHTEDTLKRADTKIKKFAL